MKYSILGKTGLVVSRLTLGTMTFGSGSTHGFEHPVNQELANKLVAQALEAGINFFDTANIYGGGLSEQFLGRAIGTHRQEVIIATKLGGRTGPALIEAGLSYHNVIAATEASLKRLGTDYLDLLQIHLPDPLTPFEETARALDNLVQRGLVRYIGYSNLGSWQAASFLAIQRQQNYATFISAQMYYSLLGRNIEQDIVPFLKYAGLGLLVWSPLAGGFLSGKYSRANLNEPKGRLTSFDYLTLLSIDREVGFTIVDKLHEIAASRQETTPAQVALAWLLEKPFVTSVIIGAATPEQFSENIAVANLELSAGEVEVLNNLTTPPPLYPYNLPTSQGDLAQRQALNPKM